MLQGDHRLQTKTTVGFSDVEFDKEKVKEREIGEIWEEVNAEGKVNCWWEQKDGYRIRYNVHPDVSERMDSIRAYLRSFPNCQKETCTCLKPTHLDEKFRRLMGMCEDCLVTMETRLKIQGKFNEYALKKMRDNANSFFEQADKEVEVLKRELQNITVVGDEHGDPVEKWGFQDPESFLNFIDENYKNFKEKIMEKFNDNKEATTGTYD